MDVTGKVYLRDRPFLLQINQLIPQTQANLRRSKQISLRSLDTEKLMELGNVTCDNPLLQTFHLSIYPPTLVRGRAHTNLKEGILFLVNQLDIGEIKEVELKLYFIPLVHNPINLVLKHDLA